MATEIQEPSDLPEGSITDQTANRYEILVYEKASDNAGIKKMGIAPWKEFFNYNGNKVNNVANYVGMPTGYPWETDENIPYGPPYAEENMTISDQLNTLQTKLGITTVPGTFDPLYPRVQSLEHDVQDATTGLNDRMSAAENDIDSIKEEIGSSGGSSGSLTARIGELETKVGNEAEGADPATGLIADVRTLQTEVEDSANGLIKKVGDIDNVLGDGTTTGLRKDVSDLKTTVGNDSLGLVHDVSDLKTTVGDSDNGLVKYVNTLQDEVENPTTGLIKKVSDLESKVYFYKGNITDVTNSGDTTTAITVDGTTIQVTVDNLKNGWVYNINPSASGVDSLIINGEKYNKGENVAIINDGSTVKFDKLGANIDVAEIEEIKEKVDAMSMVVTIDSSWTSANIPKGIYQFSCIVSSLQGKTLSVFILSFNQEGESQTQSPVDISNNFANYWELDNDTSYLKPKSFTGTRTLSIHKIGEI